MKLAKIERLIHEEGIEFVRFEQSDTHGISRSKTVPSRHFRRFAQRGLNFLLGQLGFDVQGFVASGTGYLEELGFPDSRIFPDLDTFQVVPWAENTARVICEPRFQDGRPAMAAPRLVARSLLDELAQMGFGLLSGFEYEFYLVDRETLAPPFPGIQIFATLRNTFDEELVYDILRSMGAMGVDIITANAEYGPGQMEINFAPASGIEAADQAFTFKNGVKEIVAQHGYMASFMTKPYADQSACGCHYHHSLVDLETGANAFGNPDRPEELNDRCRHFLGGQIAHAPALAALLCPTVNDYKRYKLFSFAPTNATWGWENRTVSFRLKGLRGEGPHIENRMPGAASNPYLVMAAVLAAGLDGLRNHTDPPQETRGIAYGLEGVVDLPTRLDDALNALEADTALTEALGSEFVNLYVAVKRHELAKARQNVQNYDAADFNDRVDPWEREEFFEFL
ncbi:MAG: glutamine synthetase [Caldilineae bacterium]|nr:MAG: glutamine synthetase [Caldilineae bacterium]